MTKTMLLASVAALMISAPAFSQTTGAASGAGASSTPVTPSAAPVTPAFSPTSTSTSQAGTLGEVVVTARRRAENLEKVPAAISVLGAADLQKQEVHTQADLERSVPGLTLRTTQSTQQINFSIRGQTVDGFSSSQPGVLAYVNEVQVNSLSTDSFYDLQSIQVLKGPQGTLFGRNTTGGAVLYTTGRPTNTFSGAATARFGNYADKEGQGYVNIPIVEDKVLLRLAGDLVRKDGYVKNLTTGGDAGDPNLGTERSDSGRVSLLLRPVPGLENETVAQYTHSSGTEVGGSLYYLTPCGGPNSTVACLYDPKFSPALFDAYIASNPQAARYPGGIASFYAIQKARGPYLVDHDEGSPYKSDAPQISNTTTETISSNLLIKNIFGYAKTTTTQFSDTDGTPFTIFNLGPFGAGTGQFIGDNQWSDEVQLQGKALNSNLNYVLGAYYSHEGFTNTFTQDAFQELPLLPAASVSTDSFHQTFKSEAGFAQGTYDLSDLTGVRGLKLTGGFRYTFEQVGSAQLPTSDHPGPVLNREFSDPSWTVGLDYQITNNLLLYVTQRGSWRSGGINGFQTPSPLLGSQGGSVFNSETTKDVEVGAKFQGRVADMPFRLNIDGYNQWVDNVQRVIYILVDGGPQADTANVPKAEITGFELDSQLNPTPWLTFGGSLAYTDARFTDSTVQVQGATTVFGPYPDTPRYTGTLFAEVDLPTPSDWGVVSLRGDVYAQSSDFISSTGNTLDPGSRLPSYSTTNLRFNWSNINKSNVSASLFVTNVLDKTFYTGGEALAAVIGINEAIPGPPRMFGGEIGVKF